MQQRHLTDSKTTAFLESILVCGVYIVVSNAAVAKDIFGATQWFSEFSAVESAIAGGFTTGALTQFLLMLLLVLFPFFPDARKALLSLREPASSKGWKIAISVLLIQVLVLYLGWIKDFSKLTDSSTFGISMSIVPAVDGISQEVLFRGYVILRLARSGVSSLWQIILSGALFAAIHIPYISYPGPDLANTVWTTLMPFAGTFSLGAAWAFAYRQSNYKLMPVMVSHILVIVLVQPWLAYVYSIN
ncbi:CPBP family intramembrane glutamic endopeptidase [Robiginitalea sp. IMCC43444]|uniref:CPBP family intramembrane glutamic endopeptidase n=1 Tax=Robiginitalea sp. IMCC43444 TaxID=3459121 RepID=UPI004042F12D